MITKVVHGWRVSGLLAYLMGPGRAEEHRHPRVVAVWDGREAAWQPRSSGPGEWDLELGPLIGALRVPAIAAGLPESGGPEGKRGFVWHCSARVAGGDRVLSDAEWGEVARELLHGAGVAARDDPGGRGGWRSATLMITFISRWCWCARTPFAGFGPTATSRGCGRWRGRWSSGWG